MAQETNSRVEKRHNAIMCGMVMGTRVTPQKTRFWDTRVCNAPAQRSFREALALIYYPTWTTYKRALERGKGKVYMPTPFIPPRNTFIFCHVITSNNTAALLQRMDIMSLPHFSHLRDCNNN